MMMIIRENRTMVFLNIIAWTTIIFMIFVYTLSMLTESDGGKRFVNFLLVLSFVATLISYINK